MPEATLQDHYNTQASDLTIEVHDGMLVVGPLFKVRGSLWYVARGELVQRGILRHRRYQVTMSGDIWETFRVDHEVLSEYVDGRDMKMSRDGKGGYFVEWWLVEQEDRLMTEYVQKRFATAELLPDPFSPMP